MVSRDFNEILYGFEKISGLPREEGRMEAFRKVLKDCNLMDMGFSGNWFTLERGNLLETNIQERLDRSATSAASYHYSQIIKFNIYLMPSLTTIHCSSIQNVKIKGKWRGGSNLKHGG